MNIGQGIYPILTPQQANPFASSLSRVIQQHLQNMQTQASAKSVDLQNQLASKLLPYAVPKAQAELQGMNLQNQGSSLDNQKAQALMPYLVPEAQAKLQGDQLGNQQTSLANKLAQQLMPYTVQGAQEDNALKAAQAKYYENGGAQGGNGVDLQRQNNLLNNIQKDNPNLTPDQLGAAANAILSGQSTLPDGTKLNAPSPLTQGAIGAWERSQTTAPLITQGVKANQGEAEIQTLSNMAANDIKQYGNTFAGLSPAQIADSLSSDPSKQIDLGNFIASQAAQFEIAQLRQKLAGATPTEGDTNRLLESSKQLIDAKYPKLSAAARAQAAKRLNEYFEEGLKARNKVGINAGQLTGNGAYGSSNNNDYAQSVTGNDPLSWR